MPRVEVLDVAQWKWLSRHPRSAHYWKAFFPGRRRRRQYARLRRRTIVEWRAIQKMAKGLADRSEVTL